VKKEFSIYLDLVRFVAAFLVVLFHSNIRSISKDLIPFSTHGHHAVMVFFVLSGYVISYIAAGRENTPVEYWSSRLSRFYSLAIPAVLLAPLLDLAGQSLAPAFYAGKTTHDWWALRMVSSLLFTNELWTLSIMSFSNVPYWSLCYEMWYYVLFAAAAFTKGRRRVVLLLLIALFVGPKIMVLAPIWALGVVLHRWQRLYRLAAWQYWSLFLLSIPAYLLFHHYQLSELGSEWLRALAGPAWHKQATFSRYFMTDYLLALIIAANFVGFRGIAHHFAAPLIACERPIRWVGSFTFSLYLLHQPLLQFFAALFNGDPARPWFYLQVLGATLAGVVVISLLTEQKRGHLRDLIRGWLLRLAGMRWWLRLRDEPLDAAPKT
jgi:peptidoglycan/LPS O-acetylase OafA/YrhL